MNILDQSAAESLLRDSGIGLEGLSPQALSDMVRIKLLLEHGGVWVDASLLPVLPLDTWLPPRTAPCGFFALSRPWPHVIVASWFLAAEPGHPIVRRWWDETRRYWDRPRRLIPGQPASPAESVDPKSPDWSQAYPYNWVQYLLEHSVGADGCVAKALTGDAYMDGARGRRFREALLVDAVDLDRLKQAAATCPIQKLDWRIDWSIDLIERVVRDFGSLKAD